MLGDLINITALAAGMLFLLNPCSFALLPSYLGVFLNLDEGGEPVLSSISKAQKVSLAMAAGLLAVFLPLGLFIQGVQETLGHTTSYVTIAIGLLLFLWGVLSLLGKDIVVKLPKLAGGSNATTFGGMFVYGVSYAIAAMGCSLPVVLIALTLPSDQEGFLPKLGLVVSFSIGMVVALTTLTVAIATGKSSLVKVFRWITQRMTLITGLILVPAGLFLAYYGLWELAILSGWSWLEPVVENDWVIDRYNDIQTGATNFLDTEVFDGFSRAAVLGIIFLAVNLVLAIAGWMSRRSNLETAEA